MDFCVAPILNIEHFHEVPSTALSFSRYERIPPLMIVFISKHRNFAKIIHSDAKGNVLISRRLKEGCYQQLLAKATGTATRTLSKDEVISYLNGEELEVKRTNLLRG